MSLHDVQAMRLSADVDAATGAVRDACEFLSQRGVPDDVLQLLRDYADQIEDDYIGAVTTPAPRPVEVAKTTGVLL